MVAASFSAALVVGAGVVATASAFGTQCAAGGAKPVRKEHVKIAGPVQEFPDPNMKVAFYGDVGNGPSDGNVRVMQMVKDWGAEWVVHGGDFDYIDSPSTWIAEVESVFDPEFPYFINVGNHDTVNWRATPSEPVGYADWGEKKLEQSDTAQFCAAAPGDYGVKQVCSYRGLTFVSSGVGTFGDNHPEYIREALRANPTPWRKCNWHKNQRLMQVGGKSDEVGWEVFEVCREEGAFIVNNHEHSFSRTYSMARFSEEPVVADFEEELVVQPGQVWLSVVGLGGRSIRPAQGGREENPWWANYSVSQNGAQYGAQLCTFHIDGNPRKARCEFRDIDGNIRDEFVMYTNNGIDDEGFRANMTHKNEAFRTVEMIVAHPEHDFAFKTGTRIKLGVSSSEREQMTSLSSGQYSNHSTQYISVDEDNSAGFTFSFAGDAGVPASDLTAVRQAHLQVYGSQPDGVGLANCTVFGVFPNGTVTNAYAIWDSDDEMGEAEEAWVSPDIADVVKELAEGPGFNRHVPTFSLVLRGERGTPERHFFASDVSPCYSPTLWLELA